MAQVVISEKNLSATVDNLIVDTQGFKGLSRAAAKNKLADRINEVLVNTLEKQGEEKAFHPESFWYLWKGLFCVFSPVSDAYGAFDKLSTVDIKQGNYVIVVLYSALGE